MDSYFKAAVCDLDKLLDEFEENTDEYDCYRIPQNPYDSKHHLLSSVLDCLQHAYPTPKLQENANSCTSSEEVSLASHLGAPEVLPSYSPQNEQQNISGPDLLSTVDSSSLNEIQASNLRSCSVPVCDLVNDTGNLVHSVVAQEDNQKLQPDDLQYSKSLIGFGVSCIPVPICVSSAGGSSVSGTEQSDGSSTLQESGHLKTEEVNNLALKSDSYAAAKISIPCDEQHRTEYVKCNEVSEQLEQTACLDMAHVTLQGSNVYSPEDEKAYEKMICEPQDESAGSASSKETYGRDATEKIDSKDETSIESMPSDLPGGLQLHKSHATLPVNGVLPGSSFETGAKVELEKKIIEENVGTKEFNSNEILRSVSTSFISVEDTQSPLLCFALPVSICGSSVVTDKNVTPLPQNVAEVISDTLAVHAGMTKTYLCDRESCENTDLSEPEVDVRKTHESIVKKSTDEERCNNENVIDDSDSQQIEAFASAFLDYEAELYGVGVNSYHCESLSPVMSDFTVEEKVIESDTLISDAELVDFLYGQSLQTSVLKSSDDDSNLMEADADEGNLINVNNLDFTELTEEHMQTKLEEITSMSDNLEISLTASELESAAEENMSGSWDRIESNREARVPSVHTEGARPKQLLGLSHRAVSQRQQKIRNVLERENQEASSVIPEATFSGTSQQVGKNPYPEHSGESCSEAGGNQTSENVKSLKIPAVLSWKQPLWVPDSEAPNCMNCQVKFTFTKRRHHCRACGKVFCGACCKRKCKLQYMEKEARVCTGCYNDINKAQAFERMMSPTGPGPNSSVSVECSSVPPLEEALIPGSASSPAPSASLPTPVLKQPGIEGLCPKEQRRVWFADGILPSGKVADTTKLSSGARRSSEDLSPVNPELPEAANPEEEDILPDVYPKQKEESDDTAKMQELCPSVSSDDAQQAVAGQTEVVHSYTSVILETEECSPAAEAEKTSSSSVDQTTCDVPVSPSSYRALCGVENSVRKEISFVPDGDKLPPLLLAVGEKGKDPLVEEHPSRQKVTLLLVEGGPNLLTFILNANLLVNVKLITYSSEKCWYFSTNGLHGLGQAEIVILLQCLPDEEFFPCEILKLFIDIYRDAMKAYPTPVVSFRHRKPLFGEIRHTIMNLLVDLRNYQYTLHTIDNLFVHVEMGRSCVKIPLRKYNENKHGLYHTQAISAIGYPRKVTGASFVVFNGALKTSSGFVAKSSIVEDGLMIQITPETMESLCQVLRDKKDFKITCGKMDTGDMKEILSPVDGKSMEGTPNEKVPQGRDFQREGKVMKCTEVEYLAGSGGHLLPQKYLNELDSALIPVIYGGMSDPPSLPLKMELI